MSAALSKHRPIHPGQVLAEDVIPALQAAGVTKNQFAGHLGMSRQNLDKILQGRTAITPDVAVRLGAIFGAPLAEGLLRAQWACDLDRARTKLGAAVDQLPDLSGVKLAA